MGLAFGVAFVVRVPCCPTTEPGCCGSGAGSSTSPTMAICGGGMLVLAAVIPLGEAAEFSPSLRWREGPRADRVSLSIWCVLRNELIDAQHQGRR